MCTIKKLAVVWTRIVFQIADFGMSRDLDDADYYMSEGGMIPIKWTAPEVMKD